MLKILYKNALSSMRFLFCRCLSDFCFVSGKKVSVAYEKIPATFDMLKRNPRRPSENRIKVQFWGKHTGELHRKKFTEEHEKETITFLHNWNRFFGFYFLFISSKEIIYWPCDRT